MTPEGWKTPEGLPSIPRESNIYKMQATEEATKNNKESGAGHREITEKKTEKSCKNRKLAGLKFWNNVLQ